MRCFLCLGTFVANICASLLAFSLHLISLGFSDQSIDGQVLVWLVPALRDGLCGCLSTVSTFVGELIQLRRSSAYIYGLVSVLGIQVLNVTFICLYTGLNPQVD